MAFIFFMVFHTLLKTEHCKMFPNGNHFHLKHWQMQNAHLSFYKIIRKKQEIKRPKTMGIHRLSDCTLKLNETQAERLHIEAVEMKVTQRAAIFSQTKKATQWPFSISAPLGWHGWRAPTGGPVALCSSDGCHADGAGRGAGKRQAQMASPPPSAISAHTSARWARQAARASWRDHDHTGSEIITLTVPGREPRAVRANKEGGRMTTGLWPLWKSITGNNGDGL